MNFFNDSECISLFRIILVPDHRLGYSFILLVVNDPKYRFSSNLILIEFCRLDHLEHRTNSFTKLILSTLCDLKY